MPQFDEEMMEIFEGFLVETQELLDNISQDLMDLESDPENLELINQLFRGFHTIKGTSSFMGFDYITSITHEAEDLLNKLRKGELTTNADITDILLEVHDWIIDLVERIKNDDESEPAYQVTIQTIRRLRGDTSEHTQVASPETKKKEEVAPPVEGALDSVLTDTDLVSGSEDFTDDELAQIQAAFAELNADFSGETSDGGADKEGSNKSKEGAGKEAKEEEIQAIKEISTNVEVNPMNTETKTAPKVAKKAPSKAKKTEEIKKAPPKSQNETIRIEVSRIESLMDLSGELVLGRNRLAQITEHFDANGNPAESLRDLVETTAQVDFVTSEIQSAVMKMRMVPVAKLYQKSPRIVRDIAKESGKKIKLVVKGEETEIDRGIIEELNDPLVHMIRNSCDHGIEFPEDRIKAGKAETGTVTLDADQEGNHIVLKIIDDGAGMDSDVLKDKAIEKGVITEEQADQMTEREIFQLIFHPGFSTAKKVTDVSGRGVGMDVVRTNILKLKGIINIESKKGKGSTFTIKLPLTLAIIQGLLVKVQNETYAIPLGSVEEVVSIEADSVSTVNQQEVIRIRQDVYPIVRLSKTLGLSSDDENLLDKNVVLVGLGVQRIGLVVDSLLGQQEVVIKSLGEYLGDIQGIAGSTIMGNGRVIMIIDIAELINQIYNH
jgi:two-component system, chemotaxis family, sensor kinase CheA